MTTVIDFMQNVDYKHKLSEYSREEILRFDDLVGDLLEDETVSEQYKEAVAYFYLRLHTIENEL